MMNDYYKEGKLEDLLEKYNINSLKELELALKKAEAFDIFKKYFNFKFDDINDMLLISIQAKEDEDEYDCTACANIKLLNYNPNIYNENAKEEFDFLKDVLKDE